MIDFLISRVNEANPLALIFIMFSWFSLCAANLANEDSYWHRGWEILGMATAIFALVFSLFPK